MMKTTPPPNLCASHYSLDSSIHPGPSLLFCAPSFLCVLRTGLAGGTNKTGDEQKKLDVLANEVFINALKSSGKVSVMVSEENEDAILVEPALRGPYCAVFDPLDGSSNIDCGVSIGTIFGIYRVKENSEGKVSDVLRPGKEMVAAGYCMYGSSCCLVLCLGHEVHGYTLDPVTICAFYSIFRIQGPIKPSSFHQTIGEFILTHDNIKIPPRGKTYSINEGNSLYWDAATKEYVESKKFPKKGNPYSARYIGSMVADVHRTLLYGGIFMYPADSKSPKGKLRILYEGFPMAYLVEKAGGKATTGLSRILDIQPEHIHDRSAVFLGSSEDVTDVEELYKKHNLGFQKSTENGVKSFP
eukprot:Sdes_comp19558_c0_seq2m11210